MPVRTLIRGVRRRLGMSQSELSLRSGIAGSSLSQIESGQRVPTLDTVERLLSSIGHRLIAIPTTREDVASAAAAIADSERDGRPDDAFRHFIQISDNLAAEHGDVRFALALVEPEPTGVKHWDAALAALVEYRMREEGLPLPAWAESADRRLKRSWTINAGTYVVPVDREQVPPEFLSRGVLVDAVTLASV